MLWPLLRAAEVRCLVVSGGADREDTIRAHAALLPGTTLPVCRLHAGPAALTDRIERRSRGEGPQLPGDEIKGLTAGALHRLAAQAADEAETLHRAGVGDVCVDTDGRSVQDVVARLCTLMEC